MTSSHSSQVNSRSVKMNFLFFVAIGVLLMDSFYNSPITEAELKSGNITSLEKIQKDGVLENVVTNVFGETTGTLLFDDNSPIQQVVNFNYGPLINAVATITSFVFSTSAPGYVLVNYDYAGLLQRFVPDVFKDFARGVTSLEGGQSTIIIASGLIIVSSIISFLFYVIQLGSQMAFGGGENSRSHGGRSLDEGLLEGVTKGVRVAVDNYKGILEINDNTQEENMEKVIEWIRTLTQNNNYQE